MFHPAYDTDVFFRYAEISEGIKIIHISNTGSIAWGTNTANSDQDYGFIYIDLPRHRRIQNNNRKSIRMRASEKFPNIEATGYELGYFLSMCLRGNFDAYQILRSDLQVYGSPVLRNELGGIWNAGHAVMRYQSVYAATYGRIATAELMDVEHNQNNAKEILRDLRFALIAAQCVNYPEYPVDTFPIVLPELNLAALLRMARGKKMFSDIEGIHEKVLNLRSNYDYEVAYLCMKAIVKTASQLANLVGYQQNPEKSEQKDEKFFSKANNILQSVCSAVCDDAAGTVQAFDIKSIKCQLEVYHD